MEINLLTISFIASFYYIIYIVCENIFNRVKIQDENIEIIMKLLLVFIVFPVIGLILLN